MAKKFSTSLSYNPIDSKAIAEVLSLFEGCDHEEIVTSFETSLCKTTGAKYAVALNSGTAAIHIALKILGVGQGDLVITSTFTYVGTINPIYYLGASPVFIDSEEITWNMCPELLEKAIQECISLSKKPKAIVVVHTYGMPAQMDRIMAIANHYAIPVLEDAAEAIGSTFDKKPLGTLGEVGVLSFNLNKTVTTFGGGAILTNNEALAEKALFFSTQARLNFDYYHYEEIGFNYRMGPLNAAAGLVGLKALAKNVQKRRATFERYRKALESETGIGWQKEMPLMYSNRWLSCFVFSDEKAQEIANRLAAEGTETRPLWRPMHLQIAFKKSMSFKNGVAESLFQKGLCLPSGNFLQPVDIKNLFERTKK